MVKGPIRESAIAGTWYPGDPAVLKSQVERFLAMAEVPELKGEPVGLIAPHAGYMYSGQVAGYAYKAIKGKKFDSVVIVAPSHYVWFQGVSVYAKGGYETPLGVVSIDEGLSSKLMELSPLVKELPQAHKKEHSLEIQLPFLQVVLGEFELVPLVMGDQDQRTCRELGRALADLVKRASKKVLLVASTDLSHFYPYERATVLDKAFISRVEALDPEGLIKDLEAKVCEACGAGPVVAVMFAAKVLGARRGLILKYANSGDVTGDKTSVVGYLSAIFLKEESGPIGLTEEEKQELLKIAKEVIWNKALGRPLPLFEVRSPRLKEPRGVFVTVKKRGYLRGCIGYVKPIKPLWQAVVDMAQAAAFEDPRFPPVRPEELEELEVEISVLTPLKEVKGSPDEILRQIKVGVHGLMVEKPPHYSGLLLPQVAVEYGWDEETFLKETCLKAGLPPEAWRDPLCRIYVFEAEVF